MSYKIYYCPVCSETPVYKEYNLTNGKCLVCGTTHPSVESKYEIDYYIEKSGELYDSSKSRYQVLREEEIFQNPLFSQEAYEYRKEWTAARVREKPIPDGNIRETTSHLPTCPTCHSTNIKKISFAKGYLHWRAFGLLSKTARSQFECKSCGYKW